MKVKKGLGILALSTMIIISGCSTTADPYPQNEQKPVTKVEKEKTEVQETKDKVEQEKKEIDLQVVKPNEAGQIMVLMYHAIGEPEAEFTRTPENLRKDLQYFYENGYRPISLRDYVSGNITTEAGFTPIVLTFDDGWQNNFSMIQDTNGEWIIDPNSAVAILEKFNQEHPDFPLEATFFINDNIPFEQKEHLEYKLNYIVDKGMDIGNHTANHANLTNISAEKIQKEIAAIPKMVNKYLPEYQINLLALPFGSRPKDKSLYSYLEKGSYEDIQYRNIAVLNVGWDPYKSPYHKEFDPLSIHRVRASDLQQYVQGVGMYDWFKQFEKGNRVRYISDGDPEVVTVPENYKEVIDSSKIEDKELRAYTLTE
ncbi:polysaccharide deacetylase family protein [Anaerosolibacter sp.]|uniref:polysaccharide deacetylase family protein n=1 Tax=Anaerosolibacter sp. TaxID=1872527 RepID=UPI0039F065B4